MVLSAKILLSGNVLEATASLSGSRAQDAADSQRARSRKGSCTANLQRGELTAFPSAASRLQEITITDVFRITVQTQLQTPGTCRYLVRAAQFIIISLKEK